MFAFVKDNVPGLGFLAVLQQGLELEERPARPEVVAEPGDIPSRVNGFLDILQAGLRLDDSLGRPGHSAGGVQAGRQQDWAGADMFAVLSAGLGGPEPALETRPSKQHRREGDGELDNQSLALAKHYNQWFTVSVGDQCHTGADGAGYSKHRDWNSALRDAFRPGGTKGITRRSSCRKMVGFSIRNFVASQLAEKQDLHRKTWSSNMKALLDGKDSNKECRWNMELVVQRYDEAEFRVQFDEEQFIQRCQQLQDRLAVEKRFFSGEEFARIKDAIGERRIGTAKIMNLRTEYTDNNVIGDICLIPCPAACMENTSAANIGHTIKMQCQECSVENNKLQRCPYTEYVFHLVGSDSASGVVRDIQEKHESVMPIDNYLFHESLCRVHGPHDRTKEDLKMAKVWSFCGSMQRTLKNSYTHTELVNAQITGCAHFCKHAVKRVFVHDFNARIRESRVFCKKLLGITLFRSTRVLAKFHPLSPRPVFQTPSENQRYEHGERFARDWAIKPTDFGIMSCFVNLSDNRTDRDVYIDLCIGYGLVSGWLLPVNEAAENRWENHREALAFATWQCMACRIGSASFKGRWPADKTMQRAMDARIRGDDEYQVSSTKALARISVSLASDHFLYMVCVRNVAPIPVDSMLRYFEHADSREGTVGAPLIFECLYPPRSPIRICLRQLADSMRSDGDLGFVIMAWYCHKMKDDSYFSKAFFTALNAVLWQVASVSKVLWQVEGQFPIAGWAVVAHVFFEGPDSPGTCQVSSGLHAKCMRCKDYNF